jgi:uncharacterized membrane protein YeaQ/YmgE (transglycosylase-associated protein family)
MGILWTLVIGAVAGFLAKLVMPGSDPGGFLITIALGVAGAFVGTVVGQTLGWYQPGENAGLLGAVIGALIILAGYRLARRG